MQKHVGLASTKKTTTEQDGTHMTIRSQITIPTSTSGPAATQLLMTMCTCTEQLVLIYLVSPNPCSATALRGSHALTNLSLWNCGIGGRALSNLLDGISTIPTLRVLDLHGNSLGAEGARQLGKDGLCTDSLAYVQ